MKFIKLTRGLFAQVDDSDEWLNQWKWYARRGKNTYYAVRTQRYGKRKDNKKKVIYMHRLIMDTPDDQEVDHQDHNGLNCQRHNMRNCTPSQNNMNRRPYNNKSSKYKGVVWSKSRNKFEAYIKINLKTIYIGQFNSEINAAKAYDIKAKELFGEFANLNFK